jgi:hypothetical protein
VGCCECGDEPSGSDATELVSLEQWIWRGVPQNWPSKSADLNPTDFIPWGHKKFIFYGDRVIYPE